MVQSLTKSHSVRFVGPRHREPMRVFHQNGSLTSSSSSGTIPHGVVAIVVIFVFHLFNRIFIRSIIIDNLVFQPKTAVLESLISELRSAPRSVGWGTRRELRQRGAFFTPAPLVKFVVESVLRPLADSQPRRLVVLDPACGDARFLAAAAAWKTRYLPATTLHLIGIERDHQTAEQARTTLTSLDDHSGITVEVCEGEALLGIPDLGAIDAVLGNPPYLRSIHLRSEDPLLWAALRDRFAATSHGEWDLYAPFIERSLQWVSPQGRVGLVVPSRWMTAASASKLRAAVAPAVTELIDFGSTQVFASATTYASVVLMTRQLPRPASAEIVNIDVSRLLPSGWVHTTINVSEPAGAAWIVRAGPGHRALSAATRTLGEVAQIAKGCGTNADRIFVVRGEINGESFDGHNGDGQPVHLEAAALRRCLRGRDVEATASIGPNRDGQDYCVLPYRSAGAANPPPRMSASPTLLTWSELQQELPRLADYLRVHRSALEGRERGRFAGATFYQFGRPQNLRFLLDPQAKVVIPDVAVRGRAVLDHGSLVLDSAYAVRPRVDAPGPWHHPALLRVLLRSSAVRLWLDMVGVPLRGHYFRMKTAFLAPMPLPRDGAALDHCAAAAVAGDLVGADEALRRAYDLDLETWRSVA